ncbi:hypothetical protein KC19_9G033700 [Ceratodon purpureus]|uniref:Leucine-rich repeat-containing N-terminal plant-type domain-containing protein n=1 Tax=Ceratodon purpureus TaxID=3225 RepID=A0A8T0GNB8_CERPU|nr:hypothetical protein KC19_9G033700 [Ceratodon purpureus]
MATALIFSLVAVLACSVWPFVSGTRSNDVAALQGLLRAWQGTPASLDNWSLNEDADPCGSGWKGVVCSQTQSIINLHLNDAKLSGGIPTAIGGLDELIILDLSGNPMLSSTIPMQIGHLHRLTHLKLSSCNFSGKVPREIFNMDKLEYMDLSNNPHLSLDGDAQQLIRLRQPTSFIHRRLLQKTTSGNANNNRNMPLFYTYIALGLVGLVAVIIFTFCFCRWRSLRKTRSDVFLMTPGPTISFQSKPSSRVVHVANERAEADDRH